jgi:methyl coenzyme M reductase subunit C-like uncharacterized protein (methanogenesis marker protein 7)
MYKFGRNKLDHSEKKYELSLWLCTIENKDLIILVFASFNQCKFKQKETILKLGNPLKSKSKFAIQVW